VSSPGRIFQKKHQEEDVKFAHFVLGVLLVAGPLWAAPEARYEIDAAVDVHRSIIVGTENLLVKNTTLQPINELYFFLYPNQFETKNQHLNEVNYRWHYPSGFDRGWMKLEEIRSGPGGDSLELKLVSVEHVPAGTIGLVSLSSPLEPGEETTLEIDFETKVPHKFGPFGRFRNTLTVQGGWYPYLVALDRSGRPVYQSLPDLSSVQARIRLDATRDAVVNGEFYDDVEEIEVPAQRARLISMVLTPEFHVFREKVGSDDVVFYSLFPKRYRLERVMESLQRSVGDASEFFGERREEVPVVETYLRATMTYPGEHMIFLSDRFLMTVVQFDFRNLNHLELARAVAYLFALDRVSKHEDTERYNWIAEAVGWWFRNEFMATHFEDLANLRETAGKMGMFRPFNRMAAAPTIPFTDTYIANVPVRDSLRESIFYFNNQLTSGRLLTENLELALGRERSDALFRQYLGQSRSLQSLAEASAGDELEGFFTQWEEGYPVDLDYRLTDVRRNERDGESYRTHFRVEKSTSVDFVQPLEIQVKEEGGGTQLVVWDGKGLHKDFDVESERKVQGIEIDPRRRTVETDDYNNLYPHRWEMVIDRGDQTVSSGGLGLATRIRLHKKRDFTKWMFVSPFFTPSLVGVKTGMLFNFGNTVDGLVYRRTQEMSIDYTLNYLRSGFAKPESGQFDGVGKTTGVSLGYSFDNQMFEEDPMSYESIATKVSVFRRELGGDFNFYQAVVKGKKIQALHPSHKVAGKVILGYSDGFSEGDQIPAQNLFDLQTTGNLGVVTNGRHLGKNLLSTTVEWRHDLMPHINSKMPRNWMRRLQGVLAIDAGWVSDSFSDLFDFNNTVWGIRYGFRFHYSFFGVRPSDFTVDIGHRLGAGSGDGTVISLGILQWF